MNDETPETLESAVLALVRDPHYQPVKPRVIARRLRLSKEEIPEVRKVVKKLVRQGHLAYGSKHLVKLAGAPIVSATLVPTDEPLEESTTGGLTLGDLTHDDDRPAPPLAAWRKKAGQKTVVGVFHRTQKGFGFVRPRVTAPPAVKEGAIEDGQTVTLPRHAEAKPVEDVYVPAKWHSDAASGDVVVVEVHRAHHGDPGPRGEIIEVLERETRRFVGTYYESQGGAYVQVDGTLFTQPIYVGDPGAKSARPDDKVVIEMVRFPSPVHDGEGVLVEVLGAQGSPGVDTLSIIREFDLPEAFAEDALAEARAQADQFDESVEGRLDLTAETILTIDPVDARDFDDAISLVRLENGHWRLGVHIADVSRFVRPRSPLDREAHDRGTSVYLPDRVIPMIPEIVPNGLASLQPGKVRYTKTVFMEFTPEGVRTHAEFHSAAIRSSKRLTYEQVDAFLANREALRSELEPKIHDLLGRMHELAMILRARRLKHGSLVLTMREVKIDLDPDGRVAGAHVVEDTESHQIIEEFMLAANETVAELLRDKDLGFLRRIHESPSPLKLRTLTQFVRELGFPVENLQSRFELQKLLDKVKGQPEQHAVNYAVLRSMQRATYSPKEEGHYALASDCYCHFTSPIRRYPDLVVHRLLDDLIAGRKPRDHMADLVVLGQHCSDREQRAEAAERDLTKLKLLAYLSERVGMEMDAIVTGVESFGLFAIGIELPAEGMIRIAALADDFYTYDRATHTLMGRRSGNRYRLGDQLRVVISRVDLERRELDFRLLGKPGGRIGPEKYGKRVESPAGKAVKKGNRRRK